MRIAPDLLGAWRRHRHEKRDMREWHLRSFAAPAPMHVKRSVILRLGIPGATWIETGTYLGDTTALLARHGRSVISIEPAIELASRATDRFRDTPSVRIVCGTSEERMGPELQRIDGDTNFWLDGHYSGGPTFRGESECPVTSELRCIAEARPRLGRIRVLIDDARLFGCGAPRHPDYPTLDELVQWAHSQRLDWHVEHDIFVMQSDP